MSYVEVLPSLSVVMLPLFQEAELPVLEFSALPDLFTRDPKQAAQLSKARAGAASALQRAEEEWLAASSQYDEAAG